MFPWLRFVDQTPFSHYLFSHSIIMMIMCTSATGGIMMNRRQFEWWIITTKVANQTRSMLYYESILEAQVTYGEVRLTLHSRAVYINFWTPFRTAYNQERLIFE